MKLGMSWDLGVLVLCIKQQEKKTIRFALSKAFRKNYLKRKRKLQSNTKKNKKC